MPKLNDFVSLCNVINNLFKGQRLNIFGEIDNVLLVFLKKEDMQERRETVGKNLLIHEELRDYEIRACLTKLLS